MEISIGDYVRTDNGEIHKVEDEEDLRIHIKTEKIMFRAWVEDYYGCHKEDRFIVKHSKEIKDLLQIGDIITTNNLCGEITKIDGDIIYLANYMGTCKVEDIQSIITKEQIKQIEFRIKE